MLVDLPPIDSSAAAAAAAMAGGMADIACEDLFVSAFDGDDDGDDVIQGPEEDDDAGEEKDHCDFKQKRD